MARLGRGRVDDDTRARVRDADHYKHSWQLVEAKLTNDGPARLIKHLKEARYQCARCLEWWTVDRNDLVKLFSHLWDEDWIPKQLLSGDCDGFFANLEGEIATK